jgi:hypothetical protein
MQPAEDGGVGRMLVDGDNIGLTARLQPRDEILSHQPRRGRDHDLEVIGHVVRP